MLLGLPMLAYPLGRDQAVFLTVGRTMLEGGLPYVDAWDLKPPGIYVLYAGLLALARVTHLSLDLVAGIANLAAAVATVALLCRLAERVTGLSGPAVVGAEKPPNEGGGSFGVRWRLHRLPTAGGGKWESGAGHRTPKLPRREAEAHIFAGQGRLSQDRPLGPLAGAGVAATYTALLLHGTYWSMGQTETWSNLLLVLLALSLGEPRPIRLVGAGLLTGGIALLKFTSLAPAGVILAWGVCRWSRNAPAAAGRLRPALAFTTGLLLLPVAAGLWVGGEGLAAYVDIQRGFVQPYSQIRGGGWFERVTGLFGYGLPYLLQISPALVLPVLAKWAPGRSRLPAAWLAAGVLAVWVQGKYFHYHWQATYPPLALLAGCGVAALERRRFTVAHLVALLPASWILAAAPHVTLGAMRPALGWETWERWLTRFEDGGPDHSPASTRAAARRLGRLARPGDRLQVWGMEPALYLYTGLKPANRFIFNVPVAAPFAPPAWREEYLATLQAEPPRFFVILARDAIPHASGSTSDSRELLERWPELRNWVRARYRLAAQVEDFWIGELVR